jgi:hypothetical protein
MDIDKLLERVKRYYYRHREKILKRRHKYYRENRDKILEYQRGLRLSGYYDKYKTKNKSKNKKSS